MLIALAVLGVVDLALSLRARTLARSPQGSLH
jgi:hypothetical protein